MAFSLSTASLTVSSYTNTHTKSFSSFQGRGYDDYHKNIFHIIEHCFYGFPRSFLHFFKNLILDSCTTTWLHLTATVLISLLSLSSTWAFFKRRITFHFFLSLSTSLGCRPLIPDTVRTQGQQFWILCEVQSVYILYVWYIGSSRVRQMGRCSPCCMALHAYTSVWQCDAQGLPQWFCE